MEQVDSLGNNFARGTKTVSMKSSWFISQNITALTNGTVLLSSDVDPDPPVIEYNVQSPSPSFPIPYTSPRQKRFVENMYSYSYLVWII